jgi:glycosyltransferase involved in cell wall biosynthesis
VGVDVICLGVVSDACLAELTAFAWASCIPTTAEGGGSFPMQEAMSAGVPVIASDIPVLREHVERMNGSVLFASPWEPSEFVEQLQHLEREYSAIRRASLEAMTSLKRRTWDTVAEQYAQLLEANTTP